MVKVIFFNYHQLKETLKPKITPILVNGRKI